MGSGFLESTKSGVRNGCLSCEEAFGLGRLLYRHRTSAIERDWKCVQEVRDYLEVNIYRGTAKRLGQAWYSIERTLLRSKSTSIPFVVPLRYDSVVLDGIHRTGNAEATRSKGIKGIANRKALK